MAVVKMHQKIVKMPQSEATKLRAQVLELKSDRRSLSTQLTNLHNRTAKLVEFGPEHRAQAKDSPPETPQRGNQAGPQSAVVSSSMWHSSNDSGEVN